MRKNRPPGEGEMMDVLVSVIVPVYQVEPYLRKCVDSIIGQTYSSLEIILVDDGSPDRCGQMCDQMALQDDRIRVIHQENQGLSEARNHAIDICSGSYVLFVDGDDYIEPETVERFLSAVVDADADVVCCGYIRENGKTAVPCRLTETRRILEDEEIIVASLNNEFDFFAWNKLWKRELFDEETRFPPGRYFEDLSTNWRLFNKCHCVVMVPDALFHYLVRRDGISNTKNMKNLIDHWIAYRERYDAMAPGNSELQRICMKDCLETIGYTWRWIHGIDKRERAEHDKELRDMRVFLEANRDMVRLCPITARIPLFCALHQNNVTEAACYYMNRVYRRIKGMDQMFCG